MESPGKINNEGNAGRWTKHEHKRFLEALNLHKKDWKKVQQYVGTRTTTQVRSHAQKYFAKLASKGEATTNLDQQENSEEPIKEESPQTIETKPRKVKGPYSPGKKRIRCDESKVSGVAPKVRKGKLKKRVDDGKLFTCLVEYSELEDKSFNFLSTIREEKANNSELEFDLESVCVQPLQLESFNEHFNRGGDDCNGTRPNLMTGLIL